MIRRPRSGIMGQPALIGGLALLVILALVYVSYTATKGLPFQPKYRLNVQVPNAAQLFKGASVTIAGDRVGQVLTIKPDLAPDGTPIAVFDAAIDKQYEPLPADTTALVRTSGTLGGKYLELTPGTSKETLATGATLPYDQATDEVIDVDQLLNTFQPPVRIGVRRSLDAFGLGLAGRGEGINGAVQEFVPFLGDLQPVMANLADPQTEFGRLFRAFENLAAELAPVANETADLFGDLDTTFTALAGVAPSIQDTIVEQPPTFDAAVEAFAKTEPLLHETALLFRDLRPGAEVLPETAPILADALEAGTRTLPKLSALSGRTVVAAAAIARFGENPTVTAGLDRLQETADSLRPPLNFLRPVQTQCNYIALFMRNLGSLFRESIDTGTTVRVGGVVIGVRTNSERGPSNAIDTADPKKALGPVHSNPYPNTNSAGQPNECEAGNEPYITDEAVTGNVPGAQDPTTEEASLP